MAGRTLSRRKLAGFIANQVQAGHGDKALKQAAAYLIETGQTHSVDSLVRDIEAILADRGTVVADITSAHPLGKDDKAAIAKLLGAKELYSRDVVDPSVLGGFRVEVSGKLLDATLQRKIDLLKEIDSRKGTK